MKLSTLALLTGAVLSAEIPNCAESCFENDICQSSDNDCFCNTGSYVNVLGNCIASNCINTDVDYATYAAKSICSQQGNKSPFWQVSDEIKSEIFKAQGNYQEPDYEIAMETETETYDEIFPKTTSSSEAPMITGNVFVQGTYDEIPDCAKSCAGIDASKYCDADETRCYCNNGAFVDLVGNCIASNCVNSNVVSATSVIQSYCSKANVPNPYWLISGGVKNKLNQAANKEVTTTTATTDPTEIPIYDLSERNDFINSIKSKYVPYCAQPCLQIEEDPVDCKNSDIGCYCTSTPYSNPLGECVAHNCRDVDITDFIANVKDTCESVNQDWIVDSWVQNQLDESEGKDVNEEAITSEESPETTTSEESPETTTSDETTQTNKPTIDSTGYRNSFAAIMTPIVPDCAKPCLDLDLNVYCDNDDTNCFCYLGDYVNPVGYCVADKCKGQDVKDFMTTVDGVCKEASIVDMEPYFAISNKVRDKLNEAANEESTKETSTSSTSTKISSSSTLTPTSIPTANSLVDLIYPDVPTCAQSCLAKDAPYVDCDYQDAHCYCIMGPYTDFIGDCVSNNCYGQDVKDFLNIAEKVCGKYSPVPVGPYFMLSSKVRDELNNAAQANELKPVTTVEPSTSSTESSSSSTRKTRTSSSTTISELSTTSAAPTSVDYTGYKNSFAAIMDPLVPDCAKPCLDLDLNVYCDNDDTNCFCYMGDYVDPVGYCVADKCKGQDVKDFMTTVDGVCKEHSLVDMEPYFAISNEVKDALNEAAGLENEQTTSSSETTISTTIRPEISTSSEAPTSSTINLSLPSDTSVPIINSFVDLAYLDSPKCAQSCLQMDLQVNCDYEDVHCFCIMGPYTDLIGDCIATNCFGKEVQNFMKIAEKVCDKYSPLTIPPFFMVNSTIRDKLLFAVAAEASTFTELPTETLDVISSSSTDITTSEPTTSKANASESTTLKSTVPEASVSESSIFKSSVIKSSGTEATELSKSQSSALGSSTPYSSISELNTMKSSLSLDAQSTIEAPTESSTSLVSELNASENTSVIKMSSSTISKASVTSSIEAEFSVSNKLSSTIAKHPSEHVSMHSNSESSFTSALVSSMNYSTTTTNSVNTKYPELLAAEALALESSSVATNASLSDPTQTLQSMNSTLNSLTLNSTIITKTKYGFHSSTSAVLLPQQSEFLDLEVIQESCKSIQSTIYTQISNAHVSIESCESDITSVENIYKTATITKTIQSCESELSSLSSIKSEANKVLNSHVSELSSIVSIQVGVANEQMSLAKEIDNEPEIEEASKNVQAAIAAQSSLSEAINDVPKEESEHNIIELANRASTSVVFSGLLGLASILLVIIM
ncbi:unnamed protein product [Candida verbasci]|uniref:CFEM domain-containing protein n=1 Tax=Candida verbasci TaxID=1227364 RepID=A0A9W4TVX8_9ASCO|nr:unnamed protein product [Candida verbasci]